MDKPELIAILAQLLVNSMTNGFEFDFAAVDDTQRGLRVVTRTHETFLIRVEEEEQ